jgi:hypothetical protein
MYPQVDGIAALFRASRSPGMETKFALKKRVSLADLGILPVPPCSLTTNKLGLSRLMYACRLWTLNSLVQVKLI